MSGSMQKVEREPVAQRFGRSPMFNGNPHGLVQEKINLQFIEKADRQRPVRPPGFTTLDVTTQDDFSTASTLMCFAEPANNGPDFGIGQLVEEFTSLSTYTPPLTPASTSSSSEAPIENVIGAPPVSNDSSAADASSKTFSAPILRTLNDSLRPTLCSNVSVFSGANTSMVGVVQLASSAPTPIQNSSDGDQVRLSASACSTFSSTGSSMPSTCDGSTVNDSSTLPPRARRRSPICRFCYERFVLMCLDSRQPIPATYDRGMWHGHNMKERGLVTCPHLWAVTCSHCGATKEHAHTDDYCPLKRRNPSFCRSSQNA